MDDKHLVAATRYVERNPVKARLVSEAQDWRWSSAAGHVDRRRSSLAEGEWLGELTAGWVCSWREFLVAADVTRADEKDIARLIQSHERTGRPVGDVSFVKKLERKLGRTLARGKPGPKPVRKDGFEDKGVR